MRLRHALSLLVLPLAAGCGLFGGDDEGLPPAELVDFTESIDVRKRWSTGVGDDAENLRLGLAPATDAVRVYAASRDGRVHALSMDKGKRIWSVRLKLPLTAGPGVGDGRVVVVGDDGDVVALDSRDGSELWRRKVAAEILAPPAVGGERVVLRAGDGRLLALSGATGEDVWLVEESVPRLSLRGTAAPVIAANLVVCGFDNGRLMAVELLDGTVVWEQSLNVPSGRSDLERLVDIDGRHRAVDVELRDARRRLEPDLRCGRRWRGRCVVARHRRRAMA
ncbi:MAG: PQQ-binding-like beta-propeller repeat protein, partial [Pseudomonadota bacterium]